MTITPCCRRGWFAFNCCLILAVWSHAAPLPEILAVSEAMHPYVEGKELAGVVTLVAKDGKIVHLAADGWADLASQTPLRTDALFSVASMTKPVTAVAVMMLVEEGKLTLDDPVSKYLPEFARPNLDAITIRQLLVHTSGMMGNQQNDGTLAETAAMMAKRPLAFKPGTRWSYSPGITIAGRLVEVIAGQSYEVFLDERIFEPLEMKDATFSPSSVQAPRVAKLHSPTGKGLVPTENWILGPEETRTPNPSAGLFATANDLFRFWQMLLNGGELDGKRILSKESVTELTRIQTGDMKAGFVPGSAWGLGVGIVKEPQGVTATLSPGTFGHGGAYGTQVWADPQENAIYLLLIQRTGLVNSDASPYRATFQEAAGKAIVKE